MPTAAARLYITIPYRKGFLPDKITAVCISSDLTADEVICPLDAAVSSSDRIWK
jgi:hypothetical protein